MKTKEDFAKEYYKEYIEGEPLTWETSIQCYLAGFDKSIELTQNLCKDYLKRIKELEDKLKQYGHNN